jgi:regulator of protease activity HflC (stomatin/prohibitin superfamily)
LSHLDFPDAMDAANVQRAVQSVLRDKAIAERERLQAEVETMTGRQQLAQKEADVRAIEIERIGEALRRYPEYMQYDLQSKMPEIYRQAGASGNLVITAPSPSVLVTPKATPRAAPLPAPPPRPPAAAPETP